MVQQRAQEQESQSMSLYLLPLRGVTNKTESFCRVSPTTVSPHPRSHKTSNHPSKWLPADVGHWTPSPLFPTDMPTCIANDTLGATSVTAAPQEVDVLAM